VTTEPEVWVFRPPSERCEFMRDSMTVCGRQAVAAYPARGGGYCSLCVKHMQPHQHYCVTLDEARRGKLPRMRKRPKEDEPRDPQPARIGGSEA
jgi:hypothetical protein